MGTLQKIHYDLSEVKGGYSLIITNFLDLCNMYVTVWDLIYFKSLDSVWIYLDSIEKNRNSFTVIFNFKSKRVEIVKGDSVMEYIPLDNNNIEISQKIMDIIKSKILNISCIKHIETVEDCILFL